MRNNNVTHSFEIIEDREDVTKLKPKKRMKKLAFWCIFVSLIFVITDIILLLFFGKIWFVNPMKKEYKIMGINVSSKQGKISWDSVSLQNIDFAFIRATEGESLSDKNFTENFDGALSAGIEAAPLHDFTFTSNGKDQAEAFINVVGDKNDRQLPPVVQIRLYSKYVAVPPQKDEVVKELREFIDAIYKKYGLQPIIMADEDIYEKYLDKSFPDSPICIRSIYSKPSNNEQFMFWLFNPKTKINGCETNEYMDKITILKSEEEYYNLFK